MATESLITLTFTIALLAATAVGQGYESETFKIKARVIGGQEIRDRCQSPWNHMVALRAQSPIFPVTFCSAVMLTDQILVTSADCINQFPSYTPVSAIVGELDTTMVNGNDMRMSIDSVKIHPGFDENTEDNNIGLIKLSEAAILSSCVKPAARWETDPTSCDDIDRSCVMAGWGPYAESAKPTNSRLPRSASVTVYGDLITTLLSREYGSNLPIGSLYAEGTSSFNKACFFDLGGIISCVRNGNYVLRGVIAKHNCNTDVNIPIVITDVPFYNSWINQCIDNWDSCPSL